MPRSSRIRAAVFFVAFASGAVTAGAQSHTLIVLSHSNHTVYELDPATGKILHEFVAPNQPHEGAIASGGGTIFASVPQAALVEILDGKTFQEKGRIESEYFKRPPQARAEGRGRGREGAAAEGGGREGGGGRAGRAGRSGREGGGGREGADQTPNTSASPHGMALTTDNSKLYIGVENAEIPGVVVYDVKAGKAIKKIDLLLRGGHYLQIQPGTDKLYYPHRNDNRVVVIETKTDRILKIIPVEGGPVGVAFAPNGEVWFHEDGDGSVTVADSKTDEVIKVIPTGGKGAGRMAVSADGKYAASTHSTSEDVAIIDTATKEVVATVKIGRGPGFPLFSPDSTKLYVMNSGMADVAVIDLTSMNVVARHKVGSDPFGGGVKVARR